MAALSKDVDRFPQLPDRGYTWNVTAKDATYYKGAFITADAQGAAQNATSATEPILGVYRHEERTVEAADTDKDISVVVGSIIHVKTSATVASAANLGKLVELVNNNDIKINTTATNQKLGKIIRVNTTNNIVVVDMAQTS